MIKIAALTAAVLLLIIAAAVVLAYKAGRTAERMSRGGVQDKLHRDMAAFINNTVNGTSLDPEFMVSLPPKRLEQAEELITRYRNSIGH
jgi:hypothetical protein